MRAFSRRVWLLPLLFSLAWTSSRSGATAQGRHSAPVPPSLEIEVLDPNADPVGNPAVELKSCLDGTMQVDVPPVVLVHRFYYTGDRDFQGPMLPGGPSVLVVNHPRTGERIYVPAQLLPGAPRVTYRHDSIDYDYGENAVTLSFGMFGKPRIKYRNGKEFGTRAKTAVVFVAGKVQDYSHRAGASAAFKEIGETSKQAVDTSAEIIYNAGKTVVTPVKQAFSFLPFAKALQSTADEQALRLNNRAVEEAAVLNDKAAKLTIPTLR